ncbi:MAG: B12-binding domain-containing radical SAM protein [Candidatus Pacebacteria bacterium]|nr:B12-binding domain-containing radical SAM protein [Candidatus Paceibacterota bacterium]
MSTPNLTLKERKRRRFRLVIPAFPTFNIYSSFAKRMTALGPICIGTMANKLARWDVEIIDENNYGKRGLRDDQGHPDHEGLQASRPADVVGFYGGLTSTVPRLYELAKRYKALGVVTLGGGQHFVEDNIREGLSEGLDYIILGEGEYTISEFLEACDRGASVDAIKGLAFLEAGQVVTTPSREPITDFEALPIPDFGLLRNAKLKYYPVSWARGCGMDCEFCTVKGKMRSCGPERVMAQISSLVERYHAKNFFVVDDFFGPNRKEAMSLCRMLKDYSARTGVKLRIMVQIRLEKAKDVELLRAMRAAGVNGVAIGIESPIPQDLEAMNKKLKPDQMVNWVRTFRREGFFVHGMFIFGYPRQPGSECEMSIEERTRHFRRFIRKSHLDTVQVLLPVPLPGTELTRRLEADGRIFDRDVVGWEYYDGNFPLFVPDPPLTAEQLHWGVQKIMSRFYRFKYMLFTALNVLWFPSIVLWFHRLRGGWRSWYRVWRNHLVRFGGWVVLRRWKSAYKQGTFEEKLKVAEQRLGRESRPAD